MSQFVVDASVAMKWYFQEDHAEEARRLLSPLHELFAPDLLLLEVCNAVWKRVRRSEVPVQAADAIIQWLLTAGLELTPSRDLVASTLTLAVGTGRSAYDSSYLALALERRCPLVTADRRFHDALAGGSYGSQLLWVENVP